MKIEELESWSFMTLTYYVIVSNIFQSSCKEVIKDKKLKPSRAKFRIYKQNLFAERGKGSKFQN